MQVCELFREGEKASYKDMVMQMFPKMDAQLILLVPISVRSVLDRWRWNGEKNVMFSVRSSYQNLKNNGGGMTQDQVLD